MTILDDFTSGSVSIFPSNHWEQRPVVARQRSGRRPGGLGFGGFGRKNTEGGLGMSHFTRVKVDHNSFSWQKWNCAIRLCPASGSLSL